MEPKLVILVSAYLINYSPMSVKYKPRNKTSYTKPTRDLTREIKTERTKRNAVVFTHTA
jgi:hypothetical protein